MNGHYIIWALYWTNHPKSLRFVSKIIYKAFRFGDVVQEFVIFKNFSEVTNACVWGSHTETSGLREPASRDPCEDRLAWGAIAGPTCCRSPKAKPNSDLPALPRIPNKGTIQNAGLGKATFSG